MPRKIGVKTAQKHAARDERRAVKALSATRKKGRDSYQNFMVNLGIGTDNVMSGSTYGFNPISRIRTLLEWIHRGTWIGGIAIDLVAEDMLRAGVEIQSTMPPEDIAKVQQELVHLEVWNEIEEIVKWSRLYGGALGVYMIDGQDPSTELDVERIGEGQFLGVMALDRWMVEPSMNDLVTDLGPARGLPKFYRVVADAPALRRQTIHHSRCFRMEGIRLPYWQRLMEDLWGISVIERLYDRMVAFDSATTGAAQLVYKSYLRTYKLKDLRKIAASGGEALTGLMKHVDMMRRFQSIEGITLLDAEDEMVIQQQPVMTGISDALLQFGQQLSGALQIPLVRLFGQSPAGLNSTGESDLRTYYDGIRRQQERTLRNPVDTILRLACMSIRVEIPEEFTYVFNPLWQPKDEDKIQAGMNLESAVSDAYEKGIIDRMTALKELRQGARVTGVFSNITDDAIQEAEDEPPLSQLTEAPDAEGAEEGEGEGGEGEGDGLTPQGTTAKTAARNRLKAVE